MPCSVSVSSFRCPITREMEHNWKHDDLFTKQHYYTLLFDKEEDMDLVGDTSLTSVQVEWIFVKTRMVKKYYFERIKGAWILEAINLRPVERSPQIRTMTSLFWRPLLI